MENIPNTKRVYSFITNEASDFFSSFRMTKNGKIFADFTCNWGHFSMFAFMCAAHTEASVVETLHDSPTHAVSDALDKSKQQCHVIPVSGYAWSMTDRRKYGSGKHKMTESNKPVWSGCGVECRE